MKNKHLFSAGLGMTLLIAAGCTPVQDWQWAGSEPLASCTAIGSEFEKMDIKKWPETYHAKVSKVIDAHLKQLGNSSSAEITCTAEDYGTMMKANPELQQLASSLPPWKGKIVSELELGPVLLEYLRVYECALQEKRFFLSTSPLEPSSSSSKPTSPTLGQYNTQVTEEGDLIARESASARPILERTLAIVGGLDRLRPLSMDVECIKRASLDLRNTLGLAAEAAACMPRIWDTRGSLRDDAGSPPPAQ